MKKRLLSLCLVLAIVLGAFISVPAFAETSVATVTGTNVNIRSDAGTGYDAVGQISNSIITVLDSKTDTRGKLWYKIKTKDDTIGYIISDYISFASASVFDADFKKNLKNFPESYREALTALHTLYPNWQFKADELDIDFDSAVNSEYCTSDYKGTKKYVSLTKDTAWRDARAKDSDSSTWDCPEPNWTYASRGAVAYYMDPRNSLNTDNIYAFMQLSCDESQSIDSLKAIVKGTFLEKGYDNDTDKYLKDIIEASKQSGVNAYLIASTILVEQGNNGTSPLISGKYNDFEDFYNFFNFQASGATNDEIYKSGLTYAKNVGWNSRAASIIGGAKNLSSGYLDVGQDTYYYMDFNVVNKKWNHQYATSIYDAFNKAANLKKVYSSLKDATVSFRIPVFTNIPETVSPVPTNMLYPDVPESNEYYAAIEFAKEKGTFTGYQNGYFGLADNIKREDFVLVLARFSGDDLKKYESVSLPFSDITKKHYAYNAVAWAYTNKIVGGYEDGKRFGVGDNITREQIVKIFYGYADYLNVNTSVKNTASTFKAKYSDFDTVSDWATESIVWALSVGVISGRAGKYIAPDKNCIRAEAAQIFYNIEQKSII